MSARSRLAERARRQKEVESEKAKVGSKQFDLARRLGQDYFSRALTARCGRWAMMPTRQDVVRTAVERANFNIPFRDILHTRHGANRHI